MAVYDGMSGEQPIAVTRYTRSELRQLDVPYQTHLELTDPVRPNVTHSRHQGEQEQISFDSIHMPMPQARVYFPKLQPPHTRHNCSATEEDDMKARIAEIGRLIRDRMDSVAPQAVAAASRITVLERRLDELETGTTAREILLKLMDIFSEQERLKAQTEVLHTRLASADGSFTHLQSSIDAITQARNVPKEDVHDLGRKMRSSVDQHGQLHDSYGKEHEKHQTQLNQLETTLSKHEIGISEHDAKIADHDSKIDALSVSICDLSDAINTIANHEKSGMAAPMVQVTKSSKTNDPLRTTVIKSMREQIDTLIADRDRMTSVYGELHRVAMDLHQNVLHLNERMATADGKLSDVAGCLLHLAPQPSLERHDSVL